MEEVDWELMIPPFLGCFEASERVLFLFFFWDLLEGLAVVSYLLVCCCYIYLMCKNEIGYEEMRCYVCWLDDIVDVSKIACLYASPRDVLTLVSW